MNPLKVLIVSPHWPPVSLPDMHRARMAIPHLKNNGWQCQVLCCQPDLDDGTWDEELEAVTDCQLKPERASPVPRALTAWFGLRNSALRSLPSLFFKGCSIIRRQRPDIVFFSTTMFPVFMLGALWRLLFGARYVLDFQDPWVSEYSGQRSGLYATRKYAIVQWLARRLEPIAIRWSSGLVSVSPQYVEQLSLRYEDMSRKVAAVIPFGAADDDLKHAQTTLREWTNPVFNQSDGFTHWVYAGRGGEDMKTSLSLLFESFSEALRRDKNTFSRVRMHFVGTSYAGSRAEKTIMPIAAQFGLADHVEELTDRLPYFDTLRLLLAADGLLLIGSDDSTYNASKTQLYLLTGRRLLAIVHHESAAVAPLIASGRAVVSTFNSASASKPDLETFVRPLFTDSVTSDPVVYSAEEMSDDLIGLFCRAIEDEGR